MRESPPALSYAPEGRIKYVAGDTSLDFVNTVDWHEEGPVNDRLRDYARLVEWAEGADIISTREAARLRHGALARPAEAAAVLESARSLRWVLRGVFTSLASGEPRVRALDAFNEALEVALRHRAIAPALGRQTHHPVRWLWRGLGEDVSSMLWPVTWSAAQLMTSDEARRVRMCAGPDCGWMYVDRSRNRMRRWCEMSVCGTREKSRRRTARRRPEHL
jgi:predicted RNA-binding Zn ribbon-like protein